MYGDFLLQIWISFPNMMFVNFAWLKLAGYSGIFFLNSQIEYIFDKLPFENGVTLQQRS